MDRVEGEGKISREASDVEMAGSAGSGAEEAASSDDSFNDLLYALQSDEDDKLVASRVRKVKKRKNHRVPFDGGQDSEEERYLARMAERGRKRDHPRNERDGPRVLKARRVGGKRVAKRPRRGRGKSGTMKPAYNGDSSSEDDDQKDLSSSSEEEEGECSTSSSEEEPPRKRKKKVKKGKKESEILPKRIVRAVREALGKRPDMLGVGDPTSRQMADLAEIQELVEDGRTKKAVRRLKDRMALLRAAQGSEARLAALEANYAAQGFAGASNPTSAAIAAVGPYVARQTTARYRYTQRRPSSRQGERCYNCQLEGHRARDCRLPRKGT